MNRKFGYSLQFTFDADDQDMIDKYFRVYDVCEIKLDIDNLSSLFCKPFIDYLRRHYGNRVSFHLPSQILINIDESEIYMRLLNEKLHDFPTFFIVHYDITIKETLLVDRLKRIMKILPSNSVILLENDKTLSLKEFSKAFGICKKYANELALGICFDIGHAICNERTLNTCMISSYLAQKDYIKYIHEVHIHNVLGDIDHSLFNDLSASISVVNHVLRLIPNSLRCILEVKRVNPFSQDGIQQINYFGCT